MLTGGQVHDSKAAVDVLSEIDISGSNILGDKAYGTEKNQNLHYRAKCKIHNSAKGKQF
jgi:hypothetical protein